MRNQNARCITFTLTKKGFLYLQVKDTIRHAIVSGQLTTGTRLPWIREISRNNIVSHVTFERAYRDLIREGYVLRKKGQGYFVA